MSAGAAGSQWKSLQSHGKVSGAADRGHGKRGGDSVAFCARQSPAVPDGCRGGKSGAFTQGCAFYKGGEAVSGVGKEFFRFVTNSNYFVSFLEKSLVISVVLC